MRLLHEETICDAKGEEHQYSLVMHPAREGAKLMQDIAPLLAGLFGGGDGKDTAAIASGIAAGIQSLDTHVMLRLMSRTTRDGKKLTGPDFDRAYQGNYSELFKALQFTFMSNFGDLMSLIPEAPEGEGKESAP